MVSFIHLNRKKYQFLRLHNLIAFYLSIFVKTCYKQIRMKKLVFLHGSGYDKNAYNVLMHEVAKSCGADLICFNAPFKHPNKFDKYTWFNKFEKDGRRDAVIEDYAYSLQYIKEQLNNLHIDTKNLILIGHSQGGGMAVHIGLETELSSVISICGDLPYNISYKKVAKTPIYWLEGGKDTYIDDNRKKSYQLIENNNHFHLLRLMNSTHSDFSDDFLKIIDKQGIKL